MIMLYFSLKVVVPSPCDAKTASEHSNTALRAEHVRLQAPTHAHPRTSAWARECSRGSRYSFTVSVKRVNSLNERLSHQRVVRVQRPNTQTPPYGPRIPFSEAPIRARPGTAAWHDKALGGAVILLRCWLSMSNH